MAKDTPYGESMIDLVNVSLFVDTTHTEENWHEYAKDGVLVKVRENSLNPLGNGLLEVEPCSAGTDVPLGVIRKVLGTLKNFPKKLTGQVAVRAWRINAAGGGTGAFADTDIGKRFKPDADGKAVITSTGGYGRVAGGTPANPVLSFDLIDNIR